MKKFRFSFFLMAMAVGMLWGCGDKEEHLVVSPSQLWGEWVFVRGDAEYHYRFDQDGNGNKVNLGEFESDDENNGDFTWKINGGDELELEFRGSSQGSGGIDIIKLFTITAISDMSMTWKDIYDRTMVLSRVVEQK